MLKNNRYISPLDFKNHSGIALIITVGVLAMTVIIAVSFTLNMQLEQRIAVNYLNQIKAKYLAEAGIQKTIADIRKLVEEKDYYASVDDIENDYIGETIEMDFENYGSCAVQLQDELTKVNLNTLTNTDGEAIERLKNDAGLSYLQISRIIDYRDEDGDATRKLYLGGGRWETLTSSQTADNEEDVKNKPFSSIEEIRLVKGIADGAFQDAKDFITVNKPIIRGGLLAKYYKGLSGSSPNVKIDEDGFLDTIIELGQVQMHYNDGTTYGEMPGTDGADLGWEETHDADFAGSYLMNKNGDDWRLNDFAVVYEGYIDIKPEETGTPITFFLHGLNGLRLSLDGVAVIDKWNDTYTGNSQGATGSHTFSYAGWHPIKIEFYAHSGEQKIELQWRNSGGGDFNHLKYCIPCECFGYEPPMRDDYHSEGFYKIISTGRVLSPDGSNNILAEKKISAVIKAFGTWTQTTRAEFSAPFSSVYGEFADGEFKWINWLDSCPVDMDSWTGVCMKWDNASANYEKLSDSVKLGFWDNFDEDVAYSVVFARGAEGGAASYNYFNETGIIDGDNELNLHTTARGGTAPSKQVELNEYYYSSTRENFNVFARVWERDWGHNPVSAVDDPHEPNIPVGGGYMPSERNSAEAGNAWWPECQDCVGALIVKRDKDGGESYRVFFREAYDENNPPLYTFYDYFQVRLGAGTSKDNEFLRRANLQSKTLSFVSKNNNYSAFLYGINKKEEVLRDIKLEFSGEADDYTYVRLWGNNSYDWNGNDGQGLEPLRWKGAYSENEAHFDNLRVIPEEGYFVSTPLFVGPAKVKWGRVSWNGGDGNSDLPSGTDIDMYVRTVSGGYRKSVDYHTDSILPTKDINFNEKSNAEKISGSGNWLQYKAALTSAAINVNSYSLSSATPVLEDVTITYLPAVETFCWKEEME